MEKNNEIKINTGNPKKKGVYVCYVDLPIESKFMEKKLLFWYDEWMYLGSDQRCREEVHCWIGPLPSPTKGELKRDSDVKYAIASKQQAENGTFVMGPFDTLNQAKELTGDTGDFIFRITHKKEKFTAVCRWSDKSCKWVSKKSKKKQQLTKH